MDPSIQVVAFSDFASPPALSLSAVGRRYAWTPRQESPPMPRRRELDSASERARLDGGRGAGLRRAQRKGRDGQTFRRNFGPGQDEVWTSFHRSGVVYEPGIREDQADYVIKIGIIVDTTDPRRIRRTGVREDGQTTDEYAEREGKRARPDRPPTHTHLIQ